MNLIGEAVIVPMSLIALVTGLIQGLGTRWGLFKYRWVTTKLLLTVGATLLLLLHQFKVVAPAAKRISALAVGTLPDGTFAPLGTQLVVDASLALLVLLMTTMLSVYKPWGLSAYGRSSQGAVLRGSVERRNSRLKIAIFVGAVLAGLIAKHLATGGLSHH
jgi:hypothetical protein